MRPPEAAGFAAEENVIVGNVVLYGATSGRAFFRGLAGERFAVRNSGAVTVVEGVGDHGCEYMTGGRVVVLGPTGLNFAAGMSGGIAYVLDLDGGFRSRCNTELVGFDEITGDDSEELRALVQEHLDRTGSTVAAGLLESWEASVDRFVKVMPHDYKRALAELEEPEPEEPAEPAVAPRPRRGARRGRPEGLPAHRARRLREARPAASACTTTGSTSRCRDDATLREQGGRCMDCGVPFCHEGCPLGNRIPDWNDLVYRDRWQDALTQLHATNNFPEFTGLICPAPCESACVLDINDDPVTIEQIELAIAEPRLRGGLDRRPSRPTGAPAGRSGVVGSGPAGLAVAAQLNKLGHKVTVYERDEAPGGLLRFGVPDAKLEKWIIDRRVALLEQEGIDFVCDTDVGRDRGGRGAPPAPRRGGDGDRLARAPRPRDARPRARERALRDGLPLPAQPLGGAVAGTAGAGDPAGGHHQRRGPARGGGRRRRHGHGLRVERPARGRRERADARRLPAAPDGGPHGEHARGRCRRSARAPPTRSTRAASGASAPR